MPVRARQLMLAALCGALMAAWSAVFGAGLGRARAAELAVASDVRLGGDESQTRFVLDLSAKIDLRAFTLADPYRVVVDIPQVTFQLPAKAGESGRGLVKAFLEEQIDVPVVIRLGGNGEDKAVEILQWLNGWVPAPVEGYKKDDPPDYCAKRLAALVKQGERIQPARRPPRREAMADEASRLYSFETVTGYCWPQSVAPGSDVGLHLSSAGGRPVSVEIARIGAERTEVWSGTVDAADHPTPHDASANGCDWPASATVTTGDECTS